MATHPIAILLPPSEGKAPGGAPTAWQPTNGVFGAALGDQRRLLAQALAAASGGDEKLLGVGGKHLDAAQRANAVLIGSPAWPASQRYTGVVWDHLDLASMPLAVSRRASRSVFVLSGLLGVVAVDDPTPEYRLKMGARLAPFGVLSAWWRTSLSDALNEALAKRVVIDLLPNEHRAAWVPTPDHYRECVRVTFVERDGKVAGHDAKAAKGSLARHVLMEGGDPVAALHTWRSDRFDLDITWLGEPRRPRVRATR
ncbi:unannotated protein [freshwater metagenome]|uniref:Unannotated protein n=1 Tax=freshwater metagenome TaxID=449393 RepID=A0A6J7ES58_9ZZZZ|nr:peroxide stress protein YaaA [Actinomycetota bacterium]